MDFDLEDLKPLIAGLKVRWPVRLLIPLPEKMGPA